MKMFKKLMAVVLTGVMAVSMLTGCSLSDAAKTKALEKALNSTSTQSAQMVNFNHKNSLDEKANKVWSQVLGENDKARQAALTGKDTGFIYDAKLDTTGTNAKKYAYIVVKVGDKKAEIKKSDKILGADKIMKATYVYGPSLKKTTDGKYTIADANTSTAQRTKDNQFKVNFGVKFVDDGAKENKTYYAIVVVEVA